MHTKAPAFFAALSTSLAAIVLSTSLSISSEPTREPDDPRLREGLIGYWPLDGDVTSRGPTPLVGELRGGAKFVSSPFGKSLSVNGRDGFAIVPRHPSMNVGDGEFTVAAWIRARELRQAGLICLGRYSWVHGWYFDMPHANGTVRIETVNPKNRGNGTVVTPPGVIVPDKWTHVAASVRRGVNGVVIYINGFELARGTVHAQNLDNPRTSLCIGRIQGANLFHGEIDEVYLYRRALSAVEIQALVEPGRRFATRPPSLVPSVARIGERDDVERPRDVFPGRRFTLDAGDVVAFTGQTDLVRSRREATLEGLLASHFAPPRSTETAVASPRFRNLAWEGDTVFEQWRDLNFGSWRDQLASIGASVIIAQYGQMEALDDGKTLVDFLRAYEGLLDQFATCTKRIVLLSPRPFEKPASPHVPSHVARNDSVRRLVWALRSLCDRRGYVFVDLFAPAADGRLAPPLTSNGIHLTSEAQPRVAAEIARQLGVLVPDAAGLAELETLRQAIIEKNRLWFDSWRPMNWTFAYGDRTTQPFGKAHGSRPSLRVELEAFKPLIREADEQIGELARAHREKRPLHRHPQAGTRPTAPVAAKIAPGDDPQEHSVETQLESFQVADGFEVNLFASEADGVVNPLQIRWDDRSRLWVLCAPTYPHIEPGARPGDYILVCEDSDGDGRADRFERFADGLFMPMGIEFGDGGVYLAEASELVHLVDEDGDGRADSRRVLLSGFGTADSHQMINGLTWGPGGALWFTQGHHIYSHVETPWGISKLHKSGVWRYRPRTGRLDGFFNLSTAGLNCQGVAYDDWGQIFHNSAAYSGGFYTVPGLVATLNPQQYWAMAVPDRRNTGIEFIGTRHLPPQLQGCTVWGGFMSNTVQLHRILDEDSGFTAQVLPDLIKSTQRGFRPVNVRVGPDGAIYICDWHNAIIGHYQASYRDPRRDQTHGRIWRVVAKGRALEVQPDLSSMAPRDLLEQLRSTERLTRFNAKRRLFDVPTDEVIPAIDAWLSRLDPSDPDYERLLLETMGVYEAHEAVRPDRLLQLLNANDPRVRAYGTRVVGNWADRLSDPLALLAERVRDEHARVRLEAVVASSYVASPRAIEVASEAVDMPLDRFLRHALSQTVRALKPHWYPALERGELRFDGQAERLRFVLETDGTKDVSGLVRRLAVNEDLPTAARDGLLRLLVNVGGPDDLRFAWDRAPDRIAVLDELASVASLHGRRPSGRLDTALRALLAREDLELRARAIRLTGAWRVEELEADVRRELDRVDAPPAVVLASLTALASLQGQDSLALLESFAGVEHPIAVRIGAMAAMATVEVRRAATQAAALLVAVETEATMSELITPLLSHRGGSKALADSLKERHLRVDPAKLAHRVLSSAGRSDTELLEVLNRAIGIRGSVPEYDTELAKTLATEAISKGDADRGREVFASKLANCKACHRIGGNGGDVGPDLTIVGAGRSAEFLVESVLWPNRQIREGYMSVLVVTNGGRVFTGYRLKEDDAELRLRDTTTNRVHRIAKKNIARVTDAGSAMPASVAAALTRDELRDLIRYLSELGRTRPARP